MRPTRAIAVLCVALLTAHSPYVFAQQQQSAGASRMTPKSCLRRVNWTVLSRRSRYIPIHPEPGLVASTYPSRSWRLDAG